MLFLKNVGDIDSYNIFISCHFVTKEISFIKLKLKAFALIQ